MKNSIRLLLNFALTLFIMSCDPPKDPVTEPDYSSDATKGAITLVGKVDGAIVTATIGRAGGTVESADQRIRIAIPAGALSSDQTISVQPITNQCPAGSGPAYRLLPHGINFAKPASITFNYNDLDVKGSTPQVLGIAYQKDNGMWKSLVAKSLDSTANTLTIQTSHFSDWGLFQQMFISPANSFVNPGGSVHFLVSQTVQDSEPEEGEIFVPLPTLIPAKYIERWTLSGSGTLTDQKFKADYTAPSGIPDINPAAIAVFLNKTVKIDGKEFRDIRLIANVYVAPEGLSIKIDGGEWRTYPAKVNINSTRNVILGNDGAEFASVGWVGAPSGTFHWTKSTDVAFNLNKGKTIIYQQIYGKGYVSGGSVTVNNSDETWVVGSFTVQPAGWTNTGTQPISMGTAAVKGVFRVKRVH